MARTVRNDAYLPHSLEELRERGVGEGVLALLEPGALYGAWIYGQHRVMLTPDEENKRRFERNPESEWVVVPVPYAGIPREVVLAARAALDAGYRPRVKARHRYELAGMLFCSECGLRLTGYSTGKDRRGRTYRYYCCQKRRKWGLNACAGAQVRAGEAEREMAEWVEGLLEDPDALIERVDEAIERERASVQDPAATERALAQRVLELDAKRERLLDLAADGLLTKPDLTARLGGVDAERRDVERELSRVKGAANRVREMEEGSRMLAEAFGTGLRLGITWMPPQLRREIYEAIGLTATVDPDGGMRAEARVDEAIIRFSHEAERYARAIQEADERLLKQARENPPADSSEDLERAERELARVRRELSSPTVTDTVMAVVAGEEVSR